MQQELRTALAALDELGPGYERHVRDRLLERLQTEAAHDRPAQDGEAGLRFRRLVAVGAAAALAIGLLASAALAGAAGPHYHGAWYRDGGYYPSFQRGVPGGPQAGSGQFVLPGR